VRQISDWGLGKWKEFAHTHSTEYSKRETTLAHVPPERWKCAAEDSKYDVYSFAILLWELTSGKQPYKKGIETCNCCLPAPLYLRTLWRYTNAVIIIINFKN